MIQKRCNVCSMQKPLNKYKKINDQYKNCIECYGKVRCECGAIIRESRLKRHLKSKKHLSFVNNI